MYTKPQCYPTLIGHRKIEVSLHLELLSQSSYTLSLQFTYASFKGCLLGTGLQNRFNAMSYLGMFPEDMHASKAGCVTLCSPAPIPVIPHDGKTDTYEVRTIKVQISDDASEKCPLFTSGEPEKHLQLFDIVLSYA